MQHNQHRPEEKKEAGKIVALKKSNRLQGNPESQEEHDQGRGRGKFQKKSRHADRSARRSGSFALVLPGCFTEKWPRNQQEADEATERTDERAV